MCTTIFIKIRGYVDNVFSKYTSDWDKIKLFCTPKVLRLAEILEQFKPNESEKLESNDSPTNDCTNETDHKLNETAEINENNLTRYGSDCKNESNQSTNENSPTINENDHKINETELTRDVTNLTINKTDHKINEITTKTEQMLNVIEKCDFKTLGNKIEDKVNTYESNLKEIILFSSSDKNLNNKSNLKVKVEEYKSVRGRQRVRGRPRVLKNNSVRVQLNQNPDALCGIMFLREPLMAKILFMIIVVREISIFFIN